MRRPLRSRSEIHFGGRTNVGLQTKTEYAGEYGGDSNDRGRYVERINWSPDLWKYSFKEGVSPVKKQCFQDRTQLTNFNEARNAGWVE